MNKRNESIKDEIVVNMTQNEYENIQKRIEAQAIIKGLEDMKAGRVVDGDKLINEIKKKYGI